MNNKKGFTLLEILLVIAIIGILATSVLVLVGPQRQKAQQGKALMELSGMIQPILMCRSDGYSPQAPNSNGGNEICGDGSGGDISGYGKWSSYTGTDFSGKYVSGGSFDNNSWYVHLDDGVARICCNGGSYKCWQLESAATCTATVP